MEDSRDPSTSTLGEPGKTQVIVPVGSQIFYQQSTPFLSGKGYEVSAKTGNGLLWILRTICRVLAVYRSILQGFHERLELNGSTGERHVRSDLI